MFALRLTRSLARLVLAWFVLTQGVALASPMVNPPSWQMVCSASGAVTLLSLDDAGLAGTGSHPRDCPLCWLVAAPPPDFNTALVSLPPAGKQLFPVVAVPVAARTGPALPARGPPRTA